MANGYDTSGYVGVDLEYRNYANETEKPILTGVERERMASVGLKTDDERDYQVAAVEPTEEENEAQPVEISVEVPVKTDDFGDRF